MLLAARAAAAPPSTRGGGIILGGRIVLNPSLTCELRYDSNIFFSNSRTGSGLPAGAFVLAVQPAVDLQTRSMRDSGLGARRAELRLHVGLSYREYLTPDENVSRHRAIGVDAAAMLSLFQRSMVSVDLYDNFLRTNQPPYSFSPYNIDRHSNVFGARLRVTPRGQRITLAAIYELGYDGFEDPENGPKLSNLNLLYNSLTFSFAWRFRPKTSLLVEVNELINLYLSDVEGRRTSSYPLRVSGALMGLFTAKLAGKVSVGYGNGFYTSGPSPSTVIAELEARYKVTFLSALTLGYRHNFVNSLVGSYFDLDALMMSFAQLVGRVSLHGRLSWERMAFGGAPAQLAEAGVCERGEVMPCTPQLDRVDQFVTADVKAERPLLGWLFLSLGYSLSTNFSNGYTRISSAITPVAFTKHETWLRLAVRY